MFTKAGLLIALVLVFVGYRWGRRKALARQQPAQPQAAPAQAAPQPAAAKKDWLPVKVLLAIVAILLVIAILSSLQR